MHASEFWECFIDNPECNEPVMIRHCLRSSLNESCVFSVIYVDKTRYQFTGVDTKLVPGFKPQSLTSVLWVWVIESNPHYDLGWKTSWTSVIFYCFALSSHFIADVTVSVTLWCEQFFPIASLYLASHFRSIKPIMKMLFYVKVLLIRQQLCIGDPFSCLHLNCREVNESWKHMSRQNKNKKYIYLESLWK